MKKEAIIYFPQDAEAPVKVEAFVGELLRIGKPSMQCYKHLYHSLNQSSQDLKALIKLEGLTVKVISILKMQNGAKIAVLHRKDEKNFFVNTKKIFANTPKALDSKELTIY